MIETDAQKERRLEREAGELLGTINTAGGLHGCQSARVDVTYQRPGLEEHAGHLIVWMPLDVDPWTAAREAGYKWLEELGELDYSSVDDIRSA